eukprot:4437397-Pleurochrysis_carterae.AAC.2
MQRTCAGRAWAGTMPWKRTTVRLSFTEGPFPLGQRLARQNRLRILRLLYGERLGGLQSGSRILIVCGRASHRACVLLL